MKARLGNPQVTHGERSSTAAAAGTETGVELRAVGEQVLCCHFSIPLIDICAYGSAQQLPGHGLPVQEVTHALWQTHQGRSRCSLTAKGNRWRPADTDCTHAQPADQQPVGG